jgi:hypothetical protein
MGKKMTNSCIVVAASVVSAGVNLAICVCLGVTIKRRFDSLGSRVDSLIGRLTQLGAKK